MYGLRESILGEALDLHAADTSYIFSTTYDPTSSIRRSLMSTQPEIVSEHFQM